MVNKYYRLTYNDIGIYEAVRKSVDVGTWQDILKNPKISWLPKPDIYEKNNKSYFTKKGYDMFKKNVKPIFINYINFDLVKQESIEKLNNIIYEDEYQVIIK